MAPSYTVSHKICPNCRMPYVVGSPYCTECGTPLVDPAGTTQQVTGAAVAPTDATITRFLTEEQDATSVNYILDRAPQLLVFGEEIEYIATANKNVAGLVPDCVIATDRRLIDYRRKMLGKTEIEECYWRDVRHMDIKEGRNGVTLRVAGTEGWRFIVDSLPRTQAVRLCEVGAQHSVRLQIKLQEVLAAAAYDQARQRVPQATQLPQVMQSPQVAPTTPAAQAAQAPPVPRATQLAPATQAPPLMQAPQAPPVSQAVQPLQATQAPEPIMVAQTSELPQAAPAPQVSQIPPIMLAPQVAQASLTPQVFPPQMPEIPQALQTMLTSQTPQDLHSHQTVQVPRVAQITQAAPAQATETPQATQAADLPTMPPLDQIDLAPVEPIQSDDSEQSDRRDSQPEPEPESEPESEPQTEERIVAESQGPPIPSDMDMLLTPFPPKPLSTAQRVEHEAVQSVEKQPLEAAVAKPADERPSELSTLDELPPLATLIDEETEDATPASPGMNDLDDLFFALLRKGKADSRHPGEATLSEPFTKAQHELPFPKEMPAEQVEQVGPPVNVPALLSYPSSYQDEPEQVSRRAISNALNDGGASHLHDIDSISALIFPSPMLTEGTRVNESRQPPTRNAHEHNERTPEESTAHANDARPVDPSSESPIIKLRQLKRMLDEGLISQADYEAKKADVLSQI